MNPLLHNPLSGSDVIFCDSFSDLNLFYTDQDPRKTNCFFERILKFFQSQPLTFTTYSAEGMLQNGGILANFSSSLAFAAKRVQKRSNFRGSTLDSS